GRRDDGQLGGATRQPATARHRARDPAFRARAVIDCEASRWLRWRSRGGTPSLSVMPALVAGIHVFCGPNEDLDGTATRACPSCATLSAASRVNPTCGDKPGHDASTGSIQPEHALVWPQNVAPNAADDGRMA